MGHHGTRGPRPFAQRKASTVFVRVPPGDWAAVMRGVKTEFRADGVAGSQIHNVPVPTPVVAWTKLRGRYRAQLMLLEAHWQEPVGAISEESLRREGFATLAEFRRYWMARTHRRFQPTRNALCFRVRPLRDGDLDEHAQRLLQRLYGDFMAGPVEVPA